MDPEHPPFDDFDDDVTVAFNPATAKQQRPPVDDFDDDATVAASTPAPKAEPVAAPLRPRTVSPSPTEPTRHDETASSDTRQSLRDRLPDQGASSTWRSDEETTAGSLRQPSTANRRRVLGIIAAVLAIALGVGAYIVLTTDGDADPDAEQESSRAALA